ncbi:MAG: hypothetical protein ACK47C_15985 [Paracoccaceae bacterium]|jgi:hypothetical protein
MAFILVFILLKPEAYSSMPCQIVVLHVQSKQRKSKAAMQALHDVWQNFVIFFSAFPAWQRRATDFCDRTSFSASAKQHSCSVGGC